MAASRRTETTGHVWETTQFSTSEANCKWCGASWGSYAAGGTCTDPRAIWATPQHNSGTVREVGFNRWRGFCACSWSSPVARSAQVASARLSNHQQDPQKHEDV